MTRHPGGRTCRRALPLALALLPYALFMEARFQYRARKALRAAS